MKTFTLYLALGILPAFGEPGGVQIAPITLYTSFQHEAPQAVLEALQDELEQIMAPMGFRFNWRSLSGVKGNEVSVELAVITFKGRCDVAGLLPRSVQPGALGWTHVSDGNILPFSDVDCDRVRSFVQGTLLTVSRDDREELFGRALGRVLAHELYHIFANTQKHGSCGVAKEAFSVQDLLSDDFQFEVSGSEALRAGKAHSALANSGGASSM